MIAVGRARIDEMTRLMAATVPRMGRPPPDAGPVPA
jgi:hypothetical protein